MPLCFLESVPGWKWKERDSSSTQVISAALIVVFLAPFTTSARGVPVVGSEFVDTPIKRIVVSVACSIAIAIAMKTQGLGSSFQRLTSGHHCIEQCNRQSVEPLEHVEVPFAAPKDEGFCDDYVVVGVDASERVPCDPRCSGTDCKSLSSLVFIANLLGRHDPQPVVKVRTGNDDFRIDMDDVYVEEYAQGISDEEFAQALHGLGYSLSTFDHSKLLIRESKLPIGMLQLLSRIHSPQEDLLDSFWRLIEKEFRLRRVLLRLRSVLHVITVLKAWMIVAVRLHGSAKLVQFERLLAEVDYIWVVTEEFGQGYEGERSDTGDFCRKVETLRTIATSSGAFSALSDLCGLADEVGTGSYARVVGDTFEFGYETEGDS